MSKVEENMCGGQNLMYMAFSDLGMLIRAGDQPISVGES